MMHYLLSKAFLVILANVAKVIFHSKSFYVGINHNLNSHFSLTGKITLDLIKTA